MENNDLFGSNMKKHQDEQAGILNWFAANLQDLDFEDQFKALTYFEEFVNKLKPLYIKWCVINGEAKL